MGIFHFSIADDFITYPPPEMLWTITKQFQWYIDNEGKVTLEEAFFGKPLKSKGNYAKQMADETRVLYEKFHRMVKVNPKLSQHQFLEKICNTSPSNDCRNETLGKIYEANQKNENFQESFLRSYRRWKDKNEADK